MTMEPKTLKSATRSIDLDEFELDNHLEISMEQADRGEGMFADNFDKKMAKRFANGYYTKENAKRRIKERVANGKW